MLMKVKYYDSPRIPQTVCIIQKSTEDKKVATEFN